MLTGKDYNVFVLRSVDDTVSHQLLFADENLCPNSELNVHLEWDTKLDVKNVVSGVEPPRFKSQVHHFLVDNLGHTHNFSLL